MSPLEQAQARYTDLRQRCRSAILATADASGQPAASYAPFVQDEAHHFYIFVSGLAAHTQNLQVNPRVSLMLIEDEADGREPFARCRLIWDCQAQLLPREQARWEAIADQFQQQFGNLILTLRQLPDFRLIELIPRHGQFVSGFGAAYTLEAAAPEVLCPVGPPRA